MLEFYLNNRRRSSGEPVYAILLMLGAQKLISLSQPDNTDEGTTTKKGPLSFFFSIK